MTACIRTRELRVAVVIGAAASPHICRGNVETTTVTTMFDVKVRNVCRCVCVKCIMNGSIGTSPLQYCLGALRPKLILHKCIHPLGVMLQALRINMCEHRNDSKKEKGKERERESETEICFGPLGSRNIRTSLMRHAREALCPAFYGLAECESPVSDCTR